MEFVNLIVAHAPTLIFIFLRVGSIIMMAPVVGGVQTPMQLKLGLIIIISLIMLPLTPPVLMPANLVGLTFAVAGEVLIGITIGMVIRFIFTGVEFAGQLTGFQMGLGMANVFDPVNSAQVTVLGRLLGILTILIFLTVNGHLMVIMTVERSFELIPPYSFNLSEPLVEGVLTSAKEIFMLGLKFASPMVAILIFTNIMLGILARTVPSMNMFAIGFILTMIAGFVVLNISVLMYASTLKNLFDEMWVSVFNLMRVM